MPLRSSWKACVQRVQLPPQLPISNHQQELLQALKNNQILIIAGETGSGKTTQVPKLCIQAGLGQMGKIMMTQPRRLAATRTALRICDEMQLEIGKEIGYRIRFQHLTHAATLLEVVTDGVPLSGNLENSPFKGYEVVIVDEVHERSINIDLLLGLLKMESQKRSDLKIILMSATLNLERLTEFFPTAQTFSIAGRAHPVSVEYVEPSKDASISESITSQVLLQISHGQKGNLLCFLPTEKDIRESEQKLNAQLPEGIDCLPLYSRLSQHDQDRVFKSESTRQNVILATNIAETSLTIPAVQMVIDSGLVRMLRYHPSRGIALLEVESISKASAMQRSGRAGRTSCGTCIRLYSPEVYESMEDHTVAEIKRQDISQVLLKLIALGMAQPQDFPFIEMPQTRAFKQGLDLLVFLQAIEFHNAAWRITAIGRGMVKLPLTPRLAHLMLKAKQDHMSAAMAVVSGFLSIQDPRLTPLEQLDSARLSHLQWQVKNSDHLSMLKLYQAYATQKKQLSGNQLKRWCQSHFLDWRRMREWDQLARELCELIKGHWLENFDHLNEVRFHQLILGSHLDCLLEKDRKSRHPQYTSLGRRDLIAHPSSSMSNKTCDWAVCCGFLSTSQIFALHLCKVEPKWILSQAHNLITLQYGNPYFEVKSQKVVCELRHIFKDHLIYLDKYKDYFNHDPKVATEVFIRQGLLEGKCKAPSCDALKELTDSLKIYDAAERMTNHYSHSDRLYEAWVSKLQQPCSRLSDFKRLPLEQQQLELQDVLTHIELMTCIEDFPRAYQINQHTYPIVYQFQPRTELDGAHLKCDSTVLSTLNQRELESLVPRYLNERLHQAYQCLPHAFRKEYSAFDFEHHLKCHWEHFDELSLVEALTSWLQLKTTTAKAIQRTLSDFKTREEAYRIPKLCIGEGPQQEIIHVIRDYLQAHAEILLQKTAKKTKRQLELDLHDLELLSIPERFKKIAHELKQWPEQGRLLAKLPHQSIYAWPAFINKQGRWKIIAHQNRQRALHLTLTHLGLCLGPMSATQLSFDAHELDQLRNLNQNLPTTMQALKEASRLSLWLKVRKQDCFDYEHLSRRLLQLEKKKWEKLSKRWLKWLIHCAELYQCSKSLALDSPQKTQLFEAILRCTMNGKPTATAMISKDLAQLEQETFELQLHLHWLELDRPNYDRHHDDWLALKRGFFELEKNNLYRQLYPDTWKNIFTEQPPEKLDPIHLKPALQILNQRMLELKQLEQTLAESQSWLRQLKLELEDQNQTQLKWSLKNWMEQFHNLYPSPHEQEADSLNFLNWANGFRTAYEEFKNQKYDLMDQPELIDRNRFKTVLLSTWKAKKF